MSPAKALVAAWMLLGGDAGVRYEFPSDLIVEGVERLPDGGCVGGRMLHLDAAVRPDAGPDLAPTWPCRDR
jgi:hypothetical protein